ncbi:hypothetical protein HHK36_009405 [Tetracentron sinense]|uniref:Transcription factor CBF/NF-Y/archaeal histone domain-containing protein n=1 Tax=Tetracentron sinense TaxID=13715 RepID=A0A834ZF65_TETSI|nr:hypothetical protein HHK36_009405 [Tetracentron sinense]
MAGSRRQISPVGSPPSDSDTLAGNISDSSSKEQDRFLPIANVNRIMKKSLPKNAKISKEAKETVQECVSEFISFITGEASDKCQREKRKTINGEDLIWAMTTLGFKNYVGSVKVYLNKYRETEGEKNSMARQGDQSPTKETTNYSSTNQGVNEVNKFTNVDVIEANLRSFNDGFNSLGVQVNPKNFGDGGTMKNVFTMDQIQENNDGNAKRALATYHHHGVEW